MALIFEAFFVDETMVDVFDAVLINEGLENLVATQRLLKPAEEEEEEGGGGGVGRRDPVKRLGKPERPAIYSPFSFRQILEFVFFLPLNLIPVAGTPMFLVLTGYRAGPFHHWRYYNLLGFSAKERKAYIKRKQLKYTWFGTSALHLQLVPVLSMLFLLTTAAGSALWVVKLEEARRAHHGIGDHGNDDYDGDGGGDGNRELPPPYVDDDHVV